MANKQANEAANPEQTTPATGVESTKETPATTEELLAAMSQPPAEPAESIEGQEQGQHAPDLPQKIESETSAAEEKIEDLGERLAVDGNPYRNQTGGLVIPERASSTSDPALKGYEAKMKEIADDPERADSVYNALPNSHGGKVIGTDVARELLPEYAQGREGDLDNRTCTQERMGGFRQLCPEAASAGVGRGD